MASSATEPSLLPCPCCGGEARIASIPATEGDPNGGAEYVECSGCLLCTRLIFPLKDCVRRELTEIWNLRRSAGGVPSEDMEKLRAEEILEFNGGYDAFKAGVKYSDLPDLPHDQNGVGWAWGWFLSNRPDLQERLSTVTNPPPVAWRWRRRGEDAWEITDRYQHAFGYPDLYEVIELFAVSATASTPEAVRKKVCSAIDLLEQKQDHRHPARVLLVEALALMGDPRKGGR